MASNVATLTQHTVPTAFLTYIPSRAVLGVRTITVGRLTAKTLPSALLVQRTC